MRVRRAAELRVGQFVPFLCDLADFGVSLLERGGMLGAEGLEGRACALEFEGRLFVSGFRLGERAGCGAALVHVNG